MVRGGWGLVETRDGVDLGFAAFYICKQVLGFELDMHRARLCTVKYDILSVTLFETVIKNPSQINRILVVHLYS